MWKLTVPDDVLETLRCSLCKEYLSQLPIYSYPDQEGVGCGRCPVLSDQNPVRDVSYEAVAKFLMFPCRYKPYGCLENVLPAHMQDHEESCGYKQYFCPFIPLASCPWQGPSSELFVHYEEQHKVLALNTCSFEIDLVNMYEDNYLLSRNEDLFVVHLKCEAREGVLWCSVRYIGNKKRARQLLYQIELQKHNALDKITLEKKPVDFDLSMSLDKEVAVHVDTEEIRRALGDPCSIICSIKILPNEATQNGDSPPCKTSLESVDEDILRELECPVCNEYMVPPIHQCVAGHSICSTCKPQVAECPTCRDRIQDTRNFSLEKMTRLIKYCCKYRDFDCPFVSSSEKIKMHESECKFGPYECPLKGYRCCKWKGKAGDIMEHARRDHDDNVLEVEVVSWPYDDELNVEDDDDDCFLLKAFGEVFRLSFKYKSNVFFWAMQLVGPAEDALKYQFELDILDNSKSQQRLFLRRDCAPYTKYEDAFNQGNVFVQVQFDLVNPLMNGGDLMYKCHVVQKC